VSGLVSVVFVYISAVKMVALLLNFTIIGQQAVIFLWEGGGGAEGVTTSEIHRRILVQYGEHSVTWKNICECVDRLKCRRTSYDEEQSGWPSTSQIDDHCGEMDALIKENILL